MNKPCTICGKSIERTYETRKRWLKRQFCSKACRVGVKRPEEEKERIRATCKKNCKGWEKGKPRPTHLRVRQSQKMKERVSNGLHNFWKGGVAEQSRTFKANFQNTIEYRLWRTAVFERDNYQCIWCGARNGEGKKIELNADHIQSFAEHPELRLAIDNGRTLCRECHYKRHSNK